MNAPLLIAFRLLLGCCAACAAVGSDGKDSASHAAADSAYIECKPIVALLEAMDHEGRSRGEKKAEPAYGEPVRFRVAKVGKSTDELGNPAIAIEVAESDAARFVEWSGTQGNRSVAFFFDGNLLTTLTVGAVRTPEVVLCGAPQPWTDEFVSRLVARMHAAGSETGFD